MANGSKRLTFVVTEEVKTLLSQMKKEFFYDRTKSDMVRELIDAGLAASAGKRTADAGRGRLCKRHSALP